MYQTLFKDFKYINSFISYKRTLDRYYYLYFINEEMEAQRLNSLPKHTARKWWIQIRTPGTLLTTVLFLDQHLNFSLESR